MSLVIQVTQVARRSSICHITRGRIIGTHTSTKKTVVSISSGGSTEWTLEEDKSGLTFQEWTPDVDISRPPVTIMINSSELRVTGFNSRKCFLQHLRHQYVVTSGHEEWDCEVLRSWDLPLKVCFVSG